MAMVPGGSDGDGDSVDFPGPMGEARQGPLVCAFKGMGDALAGAVMGSVFGFGSGLFKKQGFKVALQEGGSSAKTFALLSGVHSVVSCYLRRIRGVEDALNAGIAGCATGLALSTPGSPQALLQSCVSFGVFSYILESLNKPRAAMAATKSYTSRPSQQKDFPQLMQALVPVLPPFTLPPFAGLFAQFRPSKPSDDQSRRT
ncbi:mitochondrial import inner membrane translocase subunit TIM22 [Marchantia polymorpha subsp. ruderalis]|uniref:Mitochondrial import inner membrane translocase subunit TIM22 n=2 Tax=Marchantia polymorpha TaxID=3197 RepID=A0A176WE12_MARPO|nr:hypothetical protein AXG93_857s1440 [Marchantia polymorpha subsp. ruderalis]PTQ37008.1 hypothetical protein MARPO_0060s0085 [Marchantia polymorpha]BBN14037.1 hypothetical protein Mp_6g08360 [Marchantia polymorpha subsp. ruderalis]|eukprot:PTQ37008.1 hypothetical protein MARPO_0060s0085 [Marchantia polymorpha]